MSIHELEKLKEKIENYVKKTKGVDLVQIEITSRYKKTKKETVDVASLECAITFSELNHYTLNFSKSVSGKNKGGRFYCSNNGVFIEDLEKVKDILELDE